MVCVVWLAIGRKSGGRATVAPGSTFKAYLGAPCHTSKFCQLFFYKPVLGDVTATGKSGHSSGGAFGIKHGRHGMLHNAIAARSIVCSFFRVRGVVRTTASNSSDCNTGYHWQNSASRHGTYTRGWHQHTTVSKKAAVGHAQRGRTRCPTQLVRTDGRWRHCDAKGRLVHCTRRHRATPYTIRHHVRTIHSSPL